MKKKILITGIAGFIGSHLAADLIKNNHLIGIDDLSSGKLENISGLFNSGNFEFYETTIQNCHNLDKLIKKSDLVIHLASSVGILRTYNNPLYTLDNNIFASAAIIAGCLKYDKKLLLASSSEIYGNQNQKKVLETSKSFYNHVTSFRMSYTIPKLIDELKLNILKKEGLRSSSLRFFNVIGPNQTARYGMVVPRFIKQALAGKPLTIYGDGSQIRTFCDIRDIVASINHLIDDENTGYEIYNIGGKKEISINQLANIILSLTKSKSKKVYIPYSQVHEDYEEIYYRKPSITKIKKRYGWTPIYSIEDSIRSIIEHNHNDVIKI